MNIDALIYSLYFLPTQDLIANIVLSKSVLGHFDEVGWSEILKREDKIVQEQMYIFCKKHEKVLTNEIVQQICKDVVFVNTYKRLFNKGRLQEECDVIESKLSHMRYHPLPARRVISALDGDPCTHCCYERDYGYFYQRHKPNAVFVLGCCVRSEYKNQQQEDLFERYSLLRDVLSGFDSYIGYINPINGRKVRCMRCKTMGHSTLHCCTTLCKLCQDQFDCSHRLSEFRDVWYWRDDKCWVPYTKKICDMLSNSMSNRVSQVVPLYGHLKHIHVTIDPSTFQTNTITNRRRSVKRGQRQAGEVLPLWQFKFYGEESWTTYQDASILELAHRNKLTPLMVPQGNQLAFFVDLETMKIIDCRSGRIGEVKKYD
ncbi:hypothetical protein AKO1_009722 [Acrasis kona]|uniref:WWE domain-containing protein n=1 Tax=Acrasis kona TaxID=1008807 RepID=A0AAW2ZMI7_9EUKA